MQLAQTEKVLQLDQRGSGAVLFSTSDPDLPLSAWTTVEIPEETWQDMGRPSELTVTIRPGDRLN